MSSLFALLVRSVLASMRITFYYILNGVGVAAVFFFQNWGRMNSHCIVESAFSPSTPRKGTVNFHSRGPQPNLTIRFNEANNLAEGGVLPHLPVVLMTLATLMGPPA